MKHYLFLLLMLVCCMGTYTSYAQIRGTYPRDEVHLSLVKLNIEAPGDTLEQVITKHGRFTFKTRPQEAGIYYLVFHDINWSVPVLLENAKTRIDIPSERGDMRIKGGKLQKRLYAWSKENRKLQDRYRELEEQVKTDEGNEQALNSLRLDLMREMNELEDRYIAANNDNMLAVYLIWKRGALIDFLDLENKYNLLDDKLQNGVFGQEFRKWIDKTWHMKPGVLATDFCIPDTCGNPVRLSDFDGKVKILDFWASWCIPCRQANKRMVELYKKYKDQGLEIISISVDTKADQWKRAIRQDGLSWTQVSELKFANGELYSRYKLYGVPTWILLDKNNRCVSLGHAEENLEALIIQELNR